MLEYVQKHKTTSRTSVEFVDLEVHATGKFWSTEDPHCYQKESKRVTSYIGHYFGNVLEYVALLKPSQRPLKLRFSPPKTPGDPMEPNATSFPCKPAANQM